MKYVKSLVTLVDVFGFRAARQGTALHLLMRSYGFPLVDWRGSQSDRAAVIQELEALTYLQGEFAARGTLIRGVLAVGHAHGADR